MDEIGIKPVAVVVNSIDDPMEMPMGGVESLIVVRPEFEGALLGIEKNSHLWVLSWFHKASRQVLQTKPGRISHDLPTYGVFALRSPVRPNPIGLSLGELVGVEGGSLRMKKLDIINNTPVLDIKPYFENDCVFSPRTPYLRADNYEKRYHFFARQARNHHQEECAHFFAAVRMAMVAEEHLGQLNADGITLFIKGSYCLADCLQGISRARFSNPARFHFEHRDDCLQSIWKSDRGELLVKSRNLDLDMRQQSTPDHELFEIIYRTY